MVFTWRILLFVFLHGLLAVPPEDMNLEDAPLFMCIKKVRNTSKEVTMRILVMSLFIVVACSCFSNDYNSYLTKLKSDNVQIWINSSLSKKIKKLSNGTVVVIFADLWNNDKSIVECNLDSRKKYRRKSDDSTVEISDNEFLKMCKFPSIVAYKGTVCINIPYQTISIPKEFNTVGELCIGELFAVARSLFKEMPRRRVTLRIVTENKFCEIVKKGDFSDVFNGDALYKSVSLVIEKEEFKKWRKKHDELVRKLPRRKPVIYGDRKYIFKRIDGVFEIPKEAPPRTKTETWTETVYANGYGTTLSGESVHVSIPVGERLCSRTKKVTQLYDYEALKQQMLQYEEMKKVIDMDRPPKVNPEYVRSLLVSGKIRLN